MPSCNVRSSAALGAVHSDSRMRWRSRSFSVPPSLLPPRPRKRPLRLPPLEDDMEVEWEVEWEAEEAAETERDFERSRWNGDWRKRGSFEEGVGDVGVGGTGITPLVVVVVDVPTGVGTLATALVPAEVDGGAPAFTVPMLEAALALAWPLCRCADARFDEDAGIPTRSSAIMPLRKTLARMEKKSSVTRA